MGIKQNYTAALKNKVDITWPHIGSHYYYKIIWRVQFDRHIIIDDELPVTN